MTASRSRRPDRSSRATTRAEAAALYDAMQELVRVYQLRDRDRACYGKVTSNECYALEAIERASALSVGALALELDLHKSNASRIVDALEARKLVRRRADRSDGRAVKVEITAKGRDAHAAIRAGIEKRYERLLGRVSAGERKGLVEWIRSLASEAGERIGAGATRREGGSK